MRTCAHLGPALGTWKVEGMEHTHHICRAKFGRCFPAASPPGRHSCIGCPLHTAQHLPVCDVIVTSHNYGHFLDDALASVARQDSRVLGSVVVIDDASDPADNTRAVCQRHGVRYERVELRSPHRARGVGFALGSAPLVQFLDADNRLPEGYLAAASELFAQNRRLAIAYPDLQDFGDSTALRAAPATCDPAALERQNVIDTGSVWKREAIEQLAPFDRDPAGWEDWRLARDVLRSGRWEAAHHPLPLQYRRHPTQRLAQFKDRSYFEMAGLSDEVVTIFTTFSHRIQQSPQLWQRRKAWLRDQSWPHLRLVVANTSHRPLPADWADGLPPLSAVSVYNHFVGSPGLEDHSRLGRRDVECAVSTAVAAIYNRMWQGTSTEFVLILEDDVFPRPLDAVQRLMQAVTARTGAVTGKYRQRYWPYAITAYHTTPPNGRPILRLHGPEIGVSEIAGTGFGCLLARRSQLADEVIAANSADGPYYDVNLFKAVTSAGTSVRIVWDVDCDHLGPTMPPPDHDAATRITVLLPTINRPTLRRTLRSLAEQLTAIDEVWLVSDGPAASPLKQLWYDFNHLGRLIELPAGPHGDWGHTPRNKVLPQITEGTIVHLDDDDILAPGALAAVREAIVAHPRNLLLFQMRRPDGSLLPDGEDLRPGNVGTPMFVHPAGIPLAHYTPRYGGDFDFISGTLSLNRDRAVHWIPRVIVNIRPTARCAAWTAPQLATPASAPCAPATSDPAPQTEPRPAKRPPKVGPSMLIRGWNFATAMARWTAAGMPRRTESQIAERLAICQGCSHLQADHCALCGCACVEQNRLINKLALATETCPLGKWT